MCIFMAIAFATGATGFGAAATTGAMGLTLAGALSIDGAVLGGVGALTSFGGSRMQTAALRREGQAQQVQSELIRRQTEQEQNSATARKRQAEYEGAIARNNAATAEAYAADATARGGVEEKQARLRVRRAAGDIRAGFAARGVDVGEGTALEVLDDVSNVGELDALTVRNNAEREALGFRTQAGNFRSEADLADMRAAQPTIISAAPYSSALSQSTRLSSRATSFAGVGTLLGNASDLITRFGSRRTRRTVADE